MAPIPVRISFDRANDYIEIAESESLRLTQGTYSQALWIKPTSFDDLYHGVIGYQAGPLAGDRYPFIYVRNDAIYAGFGTGGNTWKGVIADGVITINSWNHVAVTFDGSSMELLVNGAVVGTNGNFAGALADDAACSAEYRPHQQPFRRIGRRSPYVQPCVDACGSAIADRSGRS